MVWKIDDEQGNEAAKISHLIVPFTRGKGLDLGCGPWKAWPHFISVDNFDEWVVAKPWAPDVRGDATDLSMFTTGKLDFVFSSHLLEHLDDTRKALKEWWRVIKADGYLVLYLPHAAFYPNIGVEGANPDHKHDFWPKDIIEHMKNVGGWDLVVSESRDQGTEYSFLQIYKKRGSSRKHLYSCDEAVAMRQKSHKYYGKRLLVIRYGGIGDCIMASAVLPGLKAQGWHITYQTIPLGEAILRHDPNIDEFWIQDRDQVPNEQLPQYWEALAREFDHVVNLSESVEGTLLAIPGRREYVLSKRARHLYMNHNYLTFQAAIAEVPPPYTPVFYPSDAEAKAAFEFREQLGDSPVILWALAGSSVHKAWPWVDKAVLSLLANTNAKIVFVGDKAAQLLETGIAQVVALNMFGIDYQASDDMKFSDLLLKIKECFGGVNRLICKSGAWQIRETLAFVEQANLIVGPETGVLNAASALPNPKVCMLSHSTHNNLTRDWVNTTTLEPTADVACYPCHRMHYNRDFCPEDEDTGASVCAASITWERVYDAITEALTRTYGAKVVEEITVGQEAAE